MRGKCLQIAEVFSDQGYNNSLADEIRLWKDPCEAPFSLPLLSVILFVPRGSWRRRGVECLRLLRYWCLLSRKSNYGYFIWEDFYHHLYQLLELERKGSSWQRKSSPWVSLKERTNNKWEPLLPFTPPVHFEILVKFVTLQSRSWNLWVEED